MPDGAVAVSRIQAVKASSESTYPCHLYHWIGWGRPVVRPPRSLDLTPMAFFL